jgi:hypothetical protein
VAGAKPWQLILVVVAMLVLTGSVVYQCNYSEGRVEFAKSIIVADVITGDLFESQFSEDSPVFVPAEHPTNKTRSMFPVYEKDGKWFVFDRFLAPIHRDMKKQAAALVDFTTGELKTTTQRPQSVKLY